MELRVILALTIVVALLVLGLAGCAPKETTEAKTQELGSDIEDLESLSDDIENFSLELNESELEELEGLL